MLALLLAALMLMAPAPFFPTIDPIEIPGQGFKTASSKSLSAVEEVMKEAGDIQNQAQSLNENLSAYNENIQSPNEDVMAVSQGYGTSESRLSSEFDIKNTLTISRALEKLFLKYPCKDERCREIYNKNRYQFYENNVIEIYALTNTVDKLIDERITPILDDINVQGVSDKDQNENIRNNIMVRQALAQLLTVIHELSAAELQLEMAKQIKSMDPVEEEDALYKTSMNDNQTTNFASISESEDMSFAFMESIRKSFAKFNDKEIVEEKKEIEKKVELKKHDKTINELRAFNEEKIKLSKEKEIKELEELNVEYKLKNEKELIELSSEPIEVKRIEKPIDLDVKPQLKEEKRTFKSNFRDRLEVKNDELEINEEIELNDLSKAKPVESKKRKSRVNVLDSEPNEEEKVEETKEQKLNDMFGEESLFSFSKKPDNKHPISLISDQLVELEDIAPLRKEVDTLMTVHNRLNDIYEYPPRLDRYREIRIQHENILLALKNIEDNIVSYMDRKFGGAGNKVWFGGKTPSQINDYEGRGGVAAKAMALFDAQKAIIANEDPDSAYEVPEMTMEDLEAKDDNYAENNEISDIASLKEFETNNAELLGDDDLEAMEEDNRRTQLLSWNTGRFLIQDIFKRPERYGVTTVAKKRVWNDNKNFYDAYIYGKFDAMKKFVDTLPILPAAQMTYKGYIDTQKLAYDNLGDDKYYPENHEMVIEVVQGVLNKITGNIKTKIADEEKNQEEYISDAEAAIASKLGQKEAAIQAEIDRANRLISEENQELANIIAQKTAQKDNKVSELEAKKVELDAEIVKVTNETAAAITVIEQARDAKIQEETTKTNASITKLTDDATSQIAQKNAEREAKVKELEDAKTAIDAEIVKINDETDIAIENLEKQKGLKIKIEGGPRGLKPKLKAKNAGFRKVEDYDDRVEEVDFDGDDEYVDNSAIIDAEIAKLNAERATKIQALEAEKTAKDAEITKVNNDVTEAIKAIEDERDAKIQDETNKLNTLISDETNKATAQIAEKTAEKQAKIAELEAQKVATDAEIEKVKSDTAAEISALEQASSAKVVAIANAKDNKIAQIKAEAAEDIKAIEDERDAKLAESKSKQSGYRDELGYFDNSETTPDSDYEVSVNGNISDFNPPTIQPQIDLNVRQLVYFDDADYNNVNQNDNNELDEMTADKFLAYKYGDVENPNDGTDSYIPEIWYLMLRLKNGNYNFGNFNDLVNIEDSEHDVEELDGVKVNAAAKETIEMIEVADAAKKCTQKYIYENSNENKYSELGLFVSDYGLKAWKKIIAPEEDEANDCDDECMKKNFKYAFASNEIGEFLNIRSAEIGYNAAAEKANADIEEINEDFIDLLALAGYKAPDNFDIMNFTKKSNNEYVYTDLELAKRKLTEYRDKLLSKAQSNYSKLSSRAGNNKLLSERLVPINKVLKAIKLDKKAVIKITEMSAKSPDIEEQIKTAEADIAMTSEYNKEANESFKDEEISVFCPVY